MPVSGILEESQAGRNGDAAALKPTASPRRRRGMRAGCWYNRHAV